MSEQHSPQVQRLITGYHKLLHEAREVVKELADDLKPRIKTSIEMAGDRLAELGELSKEEAGRVAVYLKKDIEHAARYIAEGERELADWARLDMLLLEQKLRDNFEYMVDETKLELDHMRQHSDHTGEWHTGEITAPGTLACQQCGQEVHFKEPAHIPPCPKCHASVYHRVHYK
ncbi:MAG: zinc ribbon-containing protein [Gammaproteobacteria bacterium]|nr:zinc ribbon-containing protein [Gammaproteobacteria bacterium]